MKIENIPLVMLIISIAMFSFVAGLQVGMKCKNNYPYEQYEQYKWE